MVRPIAALAAALVATATIGAGGVALAQGSMGASSSMSADAFVKKWDESSKGLLSLKAIDDAAVVKFEMLDAQHAGKLTEAQLAGVLMPGEFAMANPDGDATVGIDEWLDLVKHRFYRANVDHDGTLDLRELRSPQGEALLKLVG